MVGYELEVVECELEVVECELEVVVYTLEVVGYELEVEVNKHVDAIFLMIHTSLSMMHC